MANEDGRAARSTAWGVAAGVFAGGAIAIWQVASGSGSKFPILPAYLAAFIAAVALYMCFATVWRWWPVTGPIPLDGALESALGKRKSLCQAAGRRFFTPDLLVALLTMPGGRVARCFDQVEAGWSAQVQSQLESYADKLSAGTSGGFLPFEWADRKDVRAAQRAAWRARAPAVTDVQLLLGVLDTPSTTSQQLQATFGDRVTRLRDMAWRVASQPPVTQTPGGDSIFREPG